ncbi:PREDICTED: G-type lectin S-receptor-like serine/threonine-protein kinase LECRK3 [Ipomoea nil]|uniref:G-type lectin S-receptor-like serine/threonine-protein kinase LECRK3 n=1 Tax=Ipomoea nil TaxID=35883 RepID=UPI000901930A|nr:PREDICTED: G-type lectin S-receptor-like serine/threonine-protein kinase LECRK3 [Ipomoea nil]
MALYAFCLLLFALHLPFHSYAQGRGTIPLGSTLTATNGTYPWHSLSGDFAFGFQQLQPTNHFLLCIWYAKIIEPTIVWHANTTSPVPPGSTLQLSAQLGLDLRSPQGERLWITNGIVDKVLYAYLSDEGNFVLASSNSTMLWDSFGDPTDTLLPTQILEIGSMLISRASGGNFSQGRFYLRMLDDGNLVLSTKSVPANTDYDDDYFTSLTSDPANESNSGFRVIFDDKGSLYVLKRNNETAQLSPPSIPSASENYLRVTLDFDGVLTLYRYPRNSSGSQTWTSLWSVPDNICIEIDGFLGTGACGLNSVCSLDAYKRPSCQCPQGYSLLDPSDKYGSCKPNFVQTCEGSPENLYSFVELPDVDWPKSDFEAISPSTKEDCQKACLNDCFCGCAIYRNITCWKKKLPLSNGRVDTSLGTTVYLKVSKGDNNIPPPNPNASNNEIPERQKHQISLIALLASSLSANFLFIIVGFLGFFFVYRKKMKTFLSNNHSGESNLLSFSYKELEEATEGFNQELGRGSFGIVYKGSVQMDSKAIIVAVKKLDSVVHDADKEFQTEVAAIGLTHHKNLVRLLGFCNEGKHRLLVYEFMCNGNLAEFLFNDLKPSWSQRIKIALGVARGLAYLHEECPTQIIHCDIKPQNILLDDCYSARISDFGLAKLLKMNQSRTNTNIRGTKGYVAPEWFRNSQVTVKVDVYSFGVLLMELVSCRRSLEEPEKCGAEKAVLTEWVTDCFEDRRLDLLVGNDAEALNDMKVVERFVMVAIWCIQEETGLRPTMRSVTQMLEGVAQVHKPPYPYK